MKIPNISIKKGIIWVKIITLIWYKWPAEFLFTKLELYSIHVDHSILIYLQSVKEPIIITFINDLNIFAFITIRNMKVLNGKLASASDIVDMDLLAFYVGLKFTYDQKKKTIKFSQSD